MKKKNKYLLIMLLISMVLTACGEGDDLGEVLGDDISSEVSDNTFLVNDEMRDNLSKEWASIDIMYDYDMQSNSWMGDTYQLKNRGDYCQLIYYSSDPFEEVYCDFSIDIYNEMVDLVLSNTIEEYTLAVDEHGKIIYDTVPCIMRLYWGGRTGEHMLCKELNNITEVISKFEELKQYAQE